MTKQHFADRLAGKIHDTGSLLVMGLDPRPGWLPGDLQCDPETSVSEITQSVRSFDRQLIQIAAGRVPAVKVQIAFYEALGVPGMQAFQKTISDARDAGLLVIVDAKRGDIGTTAQAYARTFLGPVDESDPDRPLTQSGPFFNGDALTVNPLFGTDGLQPFHDAAVAHGKGLFVLVKTSNPGAADLQDLRTTADRPVYIHIAEMLNRFEPSPESACGYASTGVVVGATQSTALKRVRSVLADHFMLAPGVGAQGGNPEDLTGMVDEHGLGLIVPMSRSLIYAHRNRSADDWTQAVTDRVEHWNNQLQTLLAPS